MAKLMMDSGTASDRDRRLHQVLAAYYAAEEAGDPPDRGTLGARHPDLAADLAAFFAAQDRVRELAAPFRAPEGEAIGWDEGLPMSGAETFEVQLDGQTIGTFTPLGSQYSTLSTPMFQVTTSGSNTLAFIGLDPNGGDNTTFIDQVVFNLQSVTPSILTSASTIEPSATPLVLTFSGALNSGEADDLAAYPLDSAVRSKKVTVSSKPVPRSSATNTEAANTVTLAVRKKPPKQTRPLTIKAANLWDAEGLELDGNDHGQPSGNFVAALNNRGVIGMTRKMVESRAGRVTAAAIDAMMSEETLPKLIGRESRHPREIR
jgi:hypothetical protein